MESTKGRIIGFIQNENKQTSADNTLKLRCSKFHWMNSFCVYEFLQFTSYFIEVTSKTKKMKMVSWLLFYKCGDSLLNLKNICNEKNICKFLIIFEYVQRVQSVQTSHITEQKTTSASNMKNIIKMERIYIFAIA